MSSVDSLVRRGTRQLTEAGVPSPAVDASLLLAHVLGIEPGDVVRQRLLDTPVSDKDSAAYADLLDERARRVPLQHLTGVAYFRSLTLAVGPGVFVPRPETEAAVDHVLTALRRAETPRPVVVDLCTGSGAIALAVAAEAPALGISPLVYAVELDPLAHAWAQRNCAGTSVQVHLGDARTALPELGGSADVVVSNPPYIPPDAVPVDPEVRDHDPEVALYGRGADGLEVPRAVIARAGELLRAGGVLVMEHAETQADVLVAELTGTGWQDVVSARDLTGRPRHVLARRAQSCGGAATTDRNPRI